MATRKNILTACFVAALSVGLAACGSSTTEVVNTPPSLALGGAAAINEGMTGRTGLMVTATDGQDDTITYEVSDARFDVVGGMLVVVAGTLLDYETERSIAVDITASDGALSSDTKTANVTVRNVDDVPLTLSTSGTRGNIVEGTTGGTGLTFMADDNDMLGNLMFSTNVEGFDVIPLGEGRYELVVTQALDREQMNEVQVVVTATDDHGSKMTPTLTIAVGGVNDTPPMLGMQGVGMIDENEMGDTSVYFRPTDADGDTMFTFHVEGDNRESFRVVPAGFQTYALQVTDAFDYESDGGTVKVTVTMADSAGMSDTATFDVMVNDVNDNAPMVTTMGSAAIDEEKTGSTMLKVGVMDADSVGVDPVWTVDDARFTIDANGYLVLNEAIDYDGAMGEMSVDVGVMANDGANNSERRTVTVTINPVNDNTPVITVGGTQANLDEGTFAEAMGTGITVSVTDGDGDMVSPTVSDPRFTFADDGSLMIAANSMFDYEMMEDRSITLTIMASDGMNNAMEQTAVVTFMDVNDNKPVLKVTDQDGRAVEERNEGLVSENTRTGHKVEVLDADTGTPPKAMVHRVMMDADTEMLVKDERFSIDEDGYLIITKGTVFDFENENSIKLAITANDGQYNADNSYIIFNIADVDEPLMITSDVNLEEELELVMGPYGDGLQQAVATLTANDPDDPDARIITIWDGEKVYPKNRDTGAGLMWEENEQGEFMLNMSAGTTFLVGAGAADSGYRGYTADDADIVVYQVSAEDAVSSEEDGHTVVVRVAQKPAQVKTSDALKMYSTYTVSPTDRHTDGATVGESREGVPGDETFVPSFDHLTNKDIADDGSRLLEDWEIRRGVILGGSNFEHRSKSAIGDDGIPGSIGEWYETSMVDPSNQVPTEPMALDIVTDTRAVDVKSGNIKSRNVNKGQELAIRYRWSGSGSGTEYHEDVALIDVEGRVREEYRHGDAYTDHGQDNGRPTGGSIDYTEIDINNTSIPIRVEVIGAEVKQSTADVMSYAKFGLWSYNNTHDDCSTCPDDGLRGATAFGLKARSGDLASSDRDGKDLVGEWHGTTVAFWGEVNPDDSADSKTLGIDNNGTATITVNFDTDNVTAVMDVARHRFTFDGMLNRDNLGYAASIDTMVSDGGTGSIKMPSDEVSSDGLVLSSGGDIRATGSLDGAFYGPSILPDGDGDGSPAIDAKASAETAGTWQITDEPSSDDLGKIVIGAFGAGLQDLYLETEPEEQEE